MLHIYYSEVSWTVRSTAAVLLLCLLSACTGYPSAASRMTPEDMALDEETLSALQLHWQYAEQAVGIVVVTHGLNLDPEAMAEIRQALQEAGFHVLSLSLSGHEQGLDEQSRLARFRLADFALWRTEMARGLANARAYAQVSRLPLFLLGFSMGGLLSADYVNSHPDAGVQGLVLLAPALSLRWLSYALMPLELFPDFYLPSLASADYRANSHVPVSAYESLYDGLDTFTEKLDPANLDIPTLILVDPEDELVSAAGLRTFMDDHGLDQWQLQEVAKSKDAAAVLNHLIIDRQALGARSWLIMRDSLLQFLLDHPGSQDGTGPG